MDDDSLGAIVLAPCVVDGYVVIEIGVDIWVRTLLAILSTRSIKIYCGLFPSVETLFLLQPECQDLIVAFEEVTARGSEFM